MRALPVVVILQGAPGTGKSTLARRLMSSLGFGLLSRDPLKEYLAGTVGIASREESAVVGNAVAEACQLIAGKLVDAGKNLIFEGAFKNQFADQEFRDLQKQHPAVYIQIYCTTDEKIREQRYMNRIKTGERHQAHFDSQEYYRTMPATFYQLLPVGSQITIDTTLFGDAEYDRLLTDIQALLPVSSHD